MRLIEIWLPRIALSFFYGCGFSCLAFLLSCVPLLHPVAKVLAWPGYLFNALWPRADAPIVFEDDIMEAGIFLIWPVYALLIFVGWVLIGYFSKNHTQR